MKVRGREYLRIIYGPEYTRPENLQRLKSRGLGAKRSLALREFSLGLEGMRLSVLAGYSPYGAVSLFEKFSKLHSEYIIHAETPEEELSPLAMQSLEGYLRSHPQSSERLAQASRLIVQEGWQDRKTQKPFRVEYEVHNGKFVKGVVLSSPFRSLLSPWRAERTQKIGGTQ